MTLLYSRDVYFILLYYTSYVIGHIVSEFPVHVNIQAANLPLKWLQHDFLVHYIKGLTELRFSELNVFS